MFCRSLYKIHKFENLAKDKCVLTIGKRYEEMFIIDHEALVTAQNSEG